MTKRKWVRQTKRRRKITQEKNVKIIKIEEGDTTLEITSESEGGRGRGRESERKRVKGSK